MKNLLKIFAIFILTISHVFAVDSKKTKIACVGDSITYGFGLANREQSYPKQLGRILGDKYEVQNYGASGTCVLSKGDKPYITFKPYQNALNLKPDIVVIMLGTNDCKKQNMVNIKDFEKDLAGIVQSFQKLESSPKVYLCSTAPAFTGGVTLYGFNSEIIENEIIPRIKKTASDCNIVFIDMFKPLVSKEALFKDKIHPNEVGAKIIAETVAKELNKHKLK